MEGDKRIGPDSGGKPHCQFYLERKKRLCRMHPLPNLGFCAEHVPVTTADNEALKDTSGEFSVLYRQPCPLDPNHTVAIGNLKKHLKKCNSKPPEDKAYYKPSANTVDDNSGRDDDNLLTMTPVEKVKVIQDLVIFRQGLSPIHIPDQFGLHPYLLSDFVRSDVGESAIRHLTQIGSIAELLNTHGLLEDDTCFIEFGSGRGGLSFGLAKVVKDMNLKHCKFILIDRTSPRYKRDNRAKTAEYSNVEIERIKISIEHLLVGQLPGISEYKHIVGITKHLCGSGTDVALRSLLDEKSNCARNKVRGLVFATCCHHRTEYLDLFGNTLLCEKFANEHFRPLRQIAAWATNGDYLSTFVKNEDKADIPEELLRFFTEKDAQFPEILLKKSVGRLAKEVIDMCRAMEIEKQCADLGLKSKLVNYVDILTTRENVAILAYLPR